MIPADLKAGNPALTDEQVAYGIRRAGEIFKAHEEARDNGLANFRRQFPGVLHLADFQLAAIVAEAYREGREAGNAPAKYYECGGCGHYHPFGWTGDCRDNARRSTGAQLDSLHGAHWREVDEYTGEEA